jgi:long-subunit acyl-CoA synthetase (AMP-forming)
MLLGAAVKTANGALSRVEQIKRFAILPESWEPAGDEVTPTTKLTRQAIAAKNADVSEPQYAGPGEAAQADGADSSGHASP